MLTAFPVNMLWNLSFISNQYTEYEIDCPNLSSRIRDTYFFYNYKVGKHKFFYVSLIGNANATINILSVCKNTTKKHQKYEHLFQALSLSFPRSFSLHEIKNLDSLSFSRIQVNLAIHFRNTRNAPHCATWPYALISIEAFKFIYMHCGFAVFKV